MNGKQLAKIENEIGKLKKQLLRFDIFRPGSLTKQYGNSEEKTGGFYQLSYSHQGKGRTEYVRKEFISRIKKETLAYKKFKRLIDRWIELGIEHSKLETKLAIEEEMIEERLIF